MCRFSISCSFMYCRWRSNYQEEVVVIPITGVTPPRFCSCLKLGHGFPTSNLMIFFIFRWEVIARFVNHSGIFKTQQIKTNSMLRVRTIRSLVQGRIHKLKNCVDSRPKSVFKDQEAVKCLSSPHDKYFIIPADKASNNIVFVCKSYYFECIIKELGINSNTASNTTYKPTSFDKDEILANHRSFMSLRIYPIYIGYQNSIRHHTKKGTSGIINLFDERIVYSPDKDSVCSKRGTTEILWNCLLA
jgi:hypothetical protein